MWRKGNPSTLLVGMHTGTATVENSMGKKGVPTLHNSTDGCGEHHAKWNKPGGERHTILFQL